MNYYKDPGIWIPQRHWDPNSCLGSKYREGVHLQMA
jgi:hypothetical protein